MRIGEAATAAGAARIKEPVSLRAAAARFQCNVTEACAASCDAEQICSFP